jgi:TRAP transporter TAXI family solute receptor
MKNLMKYVAITLVLCLSIMGMTACGSKDKQSGDTGSSGKLEDILFVTGPQGGAWYAVSASMAEAIMKDVPGTRVTAIEGGALGNVRTVNSGEAQIGLVWSAFYQDGKDGVNSFEKDGKLGNIKPIMSIQENFIYIVTTTDTKINKLEDLIGKKVVPGAVASGGEFTFKNVLAAAGITYDDIEKAGGDVIFTDYGEAATLIKDGQIDAFVLTGPANMV